MNKKYNAVLEGVIYTIHKANLDEDSGKRYVSLATNYLSKRLVVKYTPYVYELEQIKEHFIQMNIKIIFYLLKHT